MAAVQISGDPIALCLLGKSRSLTAIEPINYFNFEKARANALFEAGEPFLIGVWQLERRSCLLGDCGVDGRRISVILAPLLRIARVYGKRTPEDTVQ